METIIKDSSMKHKDGTPIKVIIHNPNDKKTFDDYFTKVIIETIEKLIN
jgi:ATP-dependent Clp protease adapter protein ClpS